LSSLNMGPEHVSMHPSLEHDSVWLCVSSVAMNVLHCWPRLVHWPEAHVSESPQSVPSSAVLSAGQEPPVPEHFSSGSQGPVLARQTVSAPANWHWSVQHSSLAGSQMLFVVNLHVLGSQHGLFPHPSSPPQSHSSPASTMPLPHC